MKIHFLNPWLDRDRVQEIWLARQSECSHSFFNSWGWVDTWLSQVPPDSKVRFVYGTVGPDTKFCFHLSERKAAQHGVFYKNRGFLNTTGHHYLDSLAIEYNGILCDSDSEYSEGIFARTEFRHIEEFHLPGMDIENVESLFDDSFAVVKSLCVPSYFVDLEKIRAGESDYLSHLSANRRGQIRKSMRVAEGSGKLRLREAANLDEALQMLDALAGFHQAEWTARGEAGAFSSEFFCDFHRNLIQRKFDNGDIQLLGIKAGEVEIGYLYNFVYDNNVLFYQSGFNYEVKRGCRPGLVSHYLAILHNLANGRRKYNFLAGGLHYKKSLSTDFDNLYWWVVTRKNTKSRIELLLRHLKRGMVRVLKRS